jgi:hypothetical protein
MFPSSMMQQTVETAAGLTHETVCAGLCDPQKGLQMHFAGRRHPTISGVVQLHPNKQLQVPVEGGFVGLHLAFAVVGARWCLPFVKPTSNAGSTHQRRFTKATVDLTVSVLLQLLLHAVVSLAAKRCHTLVFDGDGPRH